MLMIPSLLVSFLTGANQKRTCESLKKPNDKQKRLNARGSLTGQSIKRGFRYYRLNLIQLATLSALSVLFALSLSGCTKERQIVRIDDEPDRIEVTRIVPVPEGLLILHPIPKAFDGMTYAELESMAILLGSELVACNADKQAISEISGQPVEPVTGSGDPAGTLARLTRLNGLAGGLARAGAGAGPAGAGLACLAVLEEAE